MCGRNWSKFYMVTSASEIVKAILFGLNDPVFGWTRFDDVAAFLSKCGLEIKGAGGGHGQ